MSKTVADRTGINQSVNVCRTFLEIVCSLLSEGEAGTTQNIDRLLTIIGVAYSGNEDVKDIVDKVLESYSKDFFENMLPDIIKDSCGVFAGPVEKFVGILGIKDVVDDFLRQRILQDQSVEKVLRGKDVYEKLVLNGVSTFVELKDAESLSLEGLLNDEKLSKGLREQLVELKELLAGSKLSRSVLRVENSLMSKLLGHLKDEDIVHMSNDRLKAILCDIVKEYVSEGIEAGAGAVGTAVRAVKKEAPKVIENAVMSGATGLGWFLGNLALVGKKTIEKLGDGIVCVAGKFEKSSGKEGAKAPAVPKSTEASADAIPAVKVDVESVTAVTSTKRPDAPVVAKTDAESKMEADPKEVKTKSSGEIVVDKLLEDPVTVPVPEVSVAETKATEISEKEDKTEPTKSEPKSAEVLAAEKELEEDFGEYLQELFAEEQPVQKPVEQRKVEQKTEESTGVMGAVADGAVAVVKGTGKVAWWGLKFGGKALWGTVKLLGRGAVAAYNYATDSSAEPKAEQ